MSEQSAGTGGTQDNSNDRKVRDILDRVAAGQLSSDEAAILLAALTTQKPEPRHAAEPSETAGPAEHAEPGEAERAQAGSDAGAGAEPTAGTEPRAGTEATAGTEPRAGTESSGDVWAEAVAAAAAEQPDQAVIPTAPDAPTETPPAAETQAKTETETETEAESPAEPKTEPKAEPTAGTDEEPAEVEHTDLPVPSGVQRVTIRAIGRRVRLIGEPAIAGVAVDGPHLIKRDGDTLAISSEGDMGVSLDGFSVLRTRSVGDLRSQVVGGIAKELSVRVNPALRVEVEVTGGSVTAERLPNLTRVRVTAGMAKVADVDGPIDLLVQAGSANLDAQLTKGRSRVRVESGAANVKLRRGSDVKVHTEAQLGKVSWTGAVNGHSKDVEIGRGRATLDVEVLVGTAQIASD